MLFALYRQRSENNDNSDTILLDTQLGQLDEGAPADWDVCFVGRVENGATRFNKGGRGFLGVAHGWRLSAQAIFAGDLHVKVPRFTGKRGPRLYEKVRVPIEVLWRLPKDKGGVLSRLAANGIGAPPVIFSWGGSLDWD